MCEHVHVDVHVCACMLSVPCIVFLVILYVCIFFQIRFFNDLEVLKIEVTIKTT